MMEFFLLFEHSGCGDGFMPAVHFGGGFRLIDLRLPAVCNTVLLFQFFRILHYSLWLEGDYHNTVGRFDVIFYPYFEKDIVPNQYHDFDKFLEDTDLVVIMVNHDQIKQNIDKLKGKVVFDTRKCCDLPGTHRL